MLKHGEAESLVQCERTSKCHKTDYNRGIIVLLST